MSATDLGVLKPNLRAVKFERTYCSIQAIRCLSSTYFPLTRVVLLVVPLSSRQSVEASEKMSGPGKREANSQRIGSSSEGESEHVRWNRTASPRLLKA
jgi:hypothetical protein